MYYSSGLEHVVNSSYSNNSYHSINYFSRNIVDNYDFERLDSIASEPKYTETTKFRKYKNQQLYFSSYSASHTFNPEMFLNPSRPTTRFIDDQDAIKNIIEETFELLMKEKLSDDIIINILPFDEFRAMHSRFGSWNECILGFSINGNSKKIFVRENNLDVLMVIIGHEIGHVLSETLPNKHDEEAKAFAFSIEWTKTIKKHNIANLGQNIRETLDFQPARNGLHDVAFEFVDFMVKKGRKAIDLHSDLVRKYASIFNKVYWS